MSLFLKKQVREKKNIYTENGNTIITAGFNNQQMKHQKQVEEYKKPEK